MRPVTHAKRGTLAIIALSAVILAATLLLTLRAVAADAQFSHASGAPEMINTEYAAAIPSNYEQTDSMTSSRNKVIGIVKAAPPTGFVGNWQILDSGTVVTVIVTADTDVKSFNNKLPRPGTWVEAKVKAQADGTVLVRKFRPNRYQPGEIVARLTATAVLTEVLTKYQQYQLTPIESLLSSARIYRFAINEDQEEAKIASVLMADRANFIWAEVNYVSEIPSDVTANPYRSWKWGSSDESGYVNQNALQQIGLPPVQGIYSGTNVVVAVLDTGIDATHPVFAGHVLSGFDFVSDDQVPQDGPEPGQSSGPAEGHGTHISGIVALVAPESKILPVRVLDVDGRGNTFVLAEAVNWAVNSGASVINMSLGSDSDATVLEEAIARAQSQGVLVVAAAGNDNLEIPQYPAFYAGVLAVTAVDDAGHKADFANYGSNWIDLAAPGVGITSSVPVSGTVLYGTWSGTSMAVPFVSGAAALVRQQWPAAQPPDISGWLIQTGRDLDALNPGYEGKLGRLLDVDAALPDVAPPPPTVEPPPPTVEPPPPSTPEPTAEATLDPTATPTPDVMVDGTPEATAEPIQSPTAEATPLPPTPTPTVLPVQTPRAVASPTPQHDVYMFMPMVTK
jgi:subtilisin family serine protease